MDTWPIWLQIPAMIGLVIAAFVFAVIVFVSYMKEQSYYYRPTLGNRYDTDPDP